MVKLIEDEFMEKYFHGKNASKQDKTYYVAFVGRKVGIFDTQKELKLSTEEFPGSYYKKFPNLSEAIYSLKSYITKGYHIRPSTEKDAPNPWARKTNLF